MSEVPEPNLDHVKSEPFRRMFVHFGRGIIYALAFWMVYAAIYRAPWSGTSTSKADDVRSEEAWKSYNSQQARAEKAMGTSEEQQKRMDAVVTKQEELMRRFEAVIAGCEKQPVGKR